MQERELTRWGNKAISEPCDFDTILNDRGWNLIGLGYALQMLTMREPALQPAVGYERRHACTRSLLFFRAIVCAVTTRAGVHPDLVGFVIQIKVKKLFHEVNSYVPRMVLIIEEHIDVTATVGFRNCPSGTSQTWPAKMNETAQQDAWYVLEGVDVAVRDELKSMMLI